jgi:hypothetical protein
LEHQGRRTRRGAIGVILMAIEKERFYFIHNRGVQYLSDRELMEEKHEADFYKNIFLKINDELNHFEQSRINQIEKEIKKRKEK